MGFLSGAEVADVMLAFESKDDTLWCPDPIRHGSFQPPVSWSRLVVADSPRPEDRRLEHRCGLCGMLISSADADLMRGVLW